MRRLLLLIILLAVNLFAGAAPPTVADIAALKALAPGAYQTVLVLRYTSADSGRYAGGGLVNWIAGSNKAAAACSVYVPNSNPTRGRWERVASSIRSAAQCGIPSSYDDTISGVTTYPDLAGSGTRMVVVSSTGTASTQSIPAGGSLANPTGTIGLSAVNGSLTSAMRSDGAPALSQAIVPTWSGIHTFTLAPVFSSVTASQILSVNGSKALTSVATTGTGSVMLAASPTTTGTLTADGITSTAWAGTGTRMVVVDASGVSSTQTIPAGGSLANPTGTIGLSAVNGSSTSGMRADGAPALSQAIVPTWSGIHTFTLAPVFSSVTASQILSVNGSKALTSVATTGTGSVMLAASPTTTGTLTAAIITASDSVLGASSRWTGRVKAQTFIANDTIGMVRGSSSLPLYISGGITPDSGMNIMLGNSGGANQLEMDLRSGRESVLSYGDGSQQFVFKKETYFNLNLIAPKKITARITAQYVIFVLSATTGSIPIDVDSSNVFKVTLTGNATLANPTGSAYGRSFLVRVKQNATGGYTLGYGSAYRFPGGTPPVITPGANAVSYLSFIYDEDAATFDFVGNAFNLLPEGS